MCSKHGKFRLLHNYGNKGKGKQMMKMRDIMNESKSTPPNKNGDLVAVETNFGQKKIQNC